MPIDDDNLLQEPGVRFGRTLVIPSAESLFTFGVQGIVSPANRRGVMGVGVAGSIRLQGGPEIEREAMAKAPMVMGSALVTGPGKLAEQGTKAIIHAVISDALGATTREDVVRKATTAALEAADRARIRSIALPPLGTGPGPRRFNSDTVLLLMIEEIVAYLRRFTSRLDRIMLVCRDDKEAREIENALVEARRLWWGLQV